MNRWDQYFYNLCETISANSKCLSRHLGAVLVRDKSIISTGYNGPPRGVLHCGDRRDKLLVRKLKEMNISQYDKRTCLVEFSSTNLVRAFIYVSPPMLRLTA
jgi:deoxycytidylate deaminase